MNKQWAGLALLSTIIVGLLIYFVFPGKIILPQVFHIFGWQLRIYGLILGLAVFVSYGWARRHGPRYHVPPASVDNISAVLILSGLIGARLYHVLSSWEYYLENPLAVFLVWHGGLSIFGAVLGGLLGLWLYQKYSRSTLAFAQTLDWLVPSLVLGQIIGRFGNLFNYEAFGSPTSVPWRMFVPMQFRLAPYETAEYFHPLFLYEAFGSLLILLILLNFSKLKGKFPWLEFPGAQFWLWVCLYGFLRFGTEILRVDSPYVFGLKQNLLLVGFMVIVALVIFWRKRLLFQTYEPHSS